MIYDLENDPVVSGSSSAEIVNHKSRIINEALREQQTLRTPVALFADEYDSKSVRDRFTHLIPLSKPNPGEQYAFQVNLDACTGCKACVAACHSLNGLDDDEAWRDVGLITGLRKQQPYQQTVTTACHHCEEPACADGCPVLAYDKDAVTGIVRHLDDQCIGCSYCILKCPYDVPKFNLKRGIVRKCDMCQSRLAEGEAPACVQACPNEAIKIQVVKLSDVPDRGSIIAGAFDSSYTRPTTTYVSAKALPDSRAADEGLLRLDHAHTPLAVMLVLTQMSAGSFLITALAVWMGFVGTEVTRLTLLTALTVGVVGIGASVLHLGQPLKAWRAFLGWRKSWLSREIIAFGVFAKLGALTVLWPSKVTLSLVALAGVLAVYTSVMVYVDTRRPFWSMKLVSGKFFGTMFLLGTAMPGVVWAWMGHSAAQIAIPAALVLRWLVSLFEMREIQKARRDEASPWHMSARILTEKLPHLLRARRVMLSIVGVVLPTVIITQFQVPFIFTLSVAITLCSQLIERHYFFTACHGPKMPGN